LRRAQAFQVAIALVTRSGLKLVIGEISACLARGGSGEILIGVDMPTEPEAIRWLLNLSGEYPETFAVKRFSSASAHIFHPKLWSFTLKSGRRLAVVGSSNLTGGGLLGNYEANVLMDSPQSVSQVADHFDEPFAGGRAKQIGERWLATYRDIFAERQRSEAAVRKLRQRVRKLEETAPVTKPIPRRIAGHSFAFTGKIPEWPRLKMLYPTIRRLRGTPSTNVSGIKSAECLAHGDIMGGRNSTRKRREARRLGVEVINQDQFLTILEREEGLQRRASRPSVKKRRMR